MRHKIMTIIAVILILFILLGIVLMIYTWLHFTHLQKKPDASISLDVGGAGAVSAFAPLGGGGIMNPDYTDPYR